MDFGTALQELKSGNKVARDGWNGRGMFVSLVPGAEQAAEFNATTAWFNPYFTIRNVDGSLSTWVPSVNDALADDWVTVAG